MILNNFNFDDGDEPLKDGEETDEKPEEESDEETSPVGWGNALEGEEPDDTM